MEENVCCQSNKMKTLKTFEMDRDGQCVAG